MSPTRTSVFQRVFSPKGQRICNMKPNDAAIRKRTQINNANRTMFLWIAGASAIVGAVIVVSIFLAQKLFYNEKVLATKQDTVNTLNHNNSVVKDLED